MRYVSLFSGIEAATLAWHPLGWTPVAFAEIEKFPSAVLSHRYPSVPNVGDVTKVDWKEFSRANGPVDLVVFGSPCQSFSVAGKRLGMDDPRGNLALHALSVVGELRPRWFIFENVPGLLSSAEGSDFGLFLRSVDELGYSACWRVLDAQYVRTCRHRGAVPQRRRRVFVVGHLGDWRRAAAVLFDRESLSGNPPPRREAGQSVAALTANGVGACGADDNQGQAGNLIASTGGMGRIDYETETMVAHTLRGEGFDASEDGTGRGTPLVPVSPTLRAGGNRTGGHRPPGTDVDTADSLVPIAFDLNQITSKTNRSQPDPAVHHTLPATTCPPHLAFQESEGGLAYGHAEKADASSALSFLREIIGEEAYREWGLRILAALQSPEVLRSWLHGECVFGKAEEAEGELVNIAQRGAGGLPDGVMRNLWRFGPNGRSSQGRGLAKQLAGESSAPLSVLPYQDAPEADVQAVRDAAQGARLLRQALSEIEALGRPAGREGQSAHNLWAVRRLTPSEVHRLQGFPDDFCNIPWRGKSHAPDGPQYKALGNSMAVNVMSWIGQRIEMVEAITAAEHLEAAE